MSPPEPRLKRAAAFVDGQNLFHAVRRVFGASQPDVDVQRLAATICESRGWTLSSVSFYTGVPRQRDDPFWHAVWSGKLRAMRGLGVTTITRPLRYRVLFSQDQDFRELADEVRAISQRQRRWVKIACAFPAAAGRQDERGVDHTDWITFDRAVYEACRDPRDYRPRSDRDGRRK